MSAIMSALLWGTMFHNIPTGTYQYNAHTYIVTEHGDIIRNNNFSSVLIAKTFQLIQCPMIAVHAIELRGLCRTIPSLNSCEIVAG
jgi:hypothetical protein